MVKMEQLIKKYYADLLTAVHSAHYLNPLEKETSNHIIIKHVVEVQKYFCNTHQAHAHPARFKLQNVAYMQQLIK